MNSADLTAEQLDVLQKQLQPHVDYLKSLLARIEQQEFPITDQLRLRVLFTLDQFEALQQVVANLATNRVNRDTYLRGIVPRDWKRQQREKRN